MSTVELKFKQEANIKIDITWLEAVNQIYMKKQQISQHVFVPYYCSLAGRISGGAAASTLPASVCTVVIAKRSESTWWSSSTPHCLLHYGMPVPARLILLPTSSSNQCCRRMSANVIIINMWRQASEDWWEARSNQCWMPDKCLPWRLPPRLLRWSGFSPHYAA